MEVGPIVRAMRHNKVRLGMIIIEIAITLAIVTNSINMILEERRQIQIPSGFDDENLVLMRSRPFVPDFREDRYLELNIDADRRAIESIPGVKRVANTSFIPWQGGGSSTEVRPTGATAKFRTQFYYSTPEIFETLGVSVLAAVKFPLQPTRMLNVEL